VSLRSRLWLLVVLVAPASALAEGTTDAERRAEASVHLKRGAQLIDAEDLTGALAEFESAYRLVPSPSILHNFGVVYQGLGRNASAIEAFERFLAEAPRPPPEIREHALRAVEALRPRVGELWVEADEPGAGIFVDGRQVARTPQGRPIYLDPGPHHVSIERGDGGTAHAERVEARAGERVTVAARLARPPPPPRPVADVAVRRSSWQRPTAWAAAAGAALAAGVMVTELVLRNQDVSSFNRQMCGTEDQGQRPECTSLQTKWRHEQTRALVGGIAAGALGLGAAALFLGAPERRGVSPGPAPSLLGLGLQGRF
jgi:hypothetical protein